MTWRGNSKVGQEALGSSRFGCESWWLLQFKPRGLFVAGLTAWVVGAD